MLTQLDLFLTPDECEMIELRRDLAIVRASNDKTRKSMYARHGELSKCVCEIAERLALLEHHICRGKQ